MSRFGIKVLCVHSFWHNRGVHRAGIHIRRITEYWQPRSLT